VRNRAKPIAEALKKLGVGVHKFMKASHATRSAARAAGRLLRRVGTERMYTGGLSWENLRDQRAAREASNN